MALHSSSTCHPPTYANALPSRKDRFKKKYAEIAKVGIAKHRGKWYHNIPLEKGKGKEIIDDSMSEEKNEYAAQFPESEMAADSHTGSAEDNEESQSDWICDDSECRFADLEHSVEICEEWTRVACSVSGGRRVMLVLQGLTSE
ncbi:MAG: hypothetical protein Q9170_005353 [Blastenia crenularia]